MAVSDRRLIRLAEVLELTGLSRDAVYRQMRDGRFPKSFHVGVKSPRWLESDVQNWIDAIVAQG